MSKSSGKKPSNLNGADIPVPPDAAAAIAVCAKHGNAASELMEILHDVMHELGHVPDSILPVIASAVNLSRAEVYGVVTFYHDYRREPAGKHVVKICRAEACQSMGTNKLCRHAQEKLNANMGETSKDGQYTIEQVFCLGNCALSPAVMIDDKLYGKVDPKRFDEIVAGLGKETR